MGSGGTVAAVVRYTGTGKATGKALDLPVVHIWDIRDGKLARFRQFIDTVKFAEVVPGPCQPWAYRPLFVNFPELRIPRKDGVRGPVVVSRAD